MSDSALLKRARTVPKRNMRRHVNRGRAPANGTLWRRRRDGARRDEWGQWEIRRLSQLGNVYITKCYRLFALSIDGVA